MVKSALLQHPKNWQGRTVLVRGTLIDLGRSLPYVLLVPPVGVASVSASTPRAVRTILAYTLPDSQVLRLHTSGGRPSPVGSTFLTVMQRLPLLNRLFPPAQEPATWQPAIYRVHLLAPTHVCARFLGQRLCYDGLLTDH